MGLVVSEIQSVTTWEQRISKATSHETETIKIIIATGWKAEPWGQSLLTEEMRKALRIARSPIRWQPDIIAANDHTREVVFIDAKTAMTSRPNWSLEKASFECHKMIQKAMGHKVYYWTSDNTVADLETIDREKTEGPPQRTGSGTPYWLISKTVYLSFHEVFSRDNTDWSNHVFLSAIYQF